MRIPYLMEPAFSGTAWCMQIEQGIRRKASALHYEAVPVEKPVKGELLLVIGTTPAWVEEVLASGATCVLVNHSADGTAAAGCVLLDYKNAMRECLGYLMRECGCRRPALLGVNTAAYADRAKLENFPPESAFLNTGSLTECCDRFLMRAESFDAVICVNFMAALALLPHVRERVPETLKIVVFGESFCGQVTVPQLTCITLDQEALGETAVQACAFLRRARPGAVLTVTVPCRILPSTSTAGVPPLGQLPQGHETAPNLFFSDPAVERYQRTERLLSGLDEQDRKILGALQNGASVPEMAQSLFAAEGSIRYRIRRMQEAAGVEHRAQLLQLLEDSLGKGFRI